MTGGAETQRLLSEIRDGRRDAWDRLFEIVYDDLRRAARSSLRGRRGRTLGTTAMVNETFLRLAGQALPVNDRMHFMAVAARAMRCVLVDEARRKAAQKRGGDAERVPLGEEDVFAGAGSDEPDALRILELDQALGRLAEANERLARVVELRFFGGLSVDETGSGARRGGAHRRAGLVQGALVSPPRAGRGMTSRERWERIERVLDRLFELPPESRVEALDGLVGDDVELREEVRALLDAGGSTGVLDRSLEEIADPILAAAEVPPGARVGSQIGPYRLLESLGRGGMGEVYLADRADGEFERRVALKVVRAELGGRSVDRRFRHERQILARLRHPNIASLYDGGTTPDGAPYFVMEHVEGRPITRYAEEEGLAVDARLELFEAVCAGVSHAHRNLVIHRDLKPSNVLVTPDGVVKLLDFGVAKVLDPEVSSLEGSESPVAAGESVGSTPTPTRSPYATSSPTRGLLTPEYASPEQVRGVPTTTATDVFSLGVLLGELLVGSGFRAGERSGWERVSGWERASGWEPASGRAWAWGWKWASGWERASESPPRRSTRDLEEGTTRGPRRTLRVGG